MANLTINGKSITVDVEDDTPLRWAIRENVGLTGTKYGCGIAQCGACTVHIDGVAMRSCGKAGLLRFARNDGPSVVIAREGGRSSIPETPAIDPRGRGVLYPRMRGG